MAIKIVNQRPGIRDVADRAGVSLSSVSRVLDDHPDVSTRMRNRVMDAVSALGYRPNPLAQSMRTGTTMTIGFVAGDTSNPLLAHISLAAETRLRQWGYSLLVTNSNNDAKNESTNISVLLSRRVDGLLLSVADESNKELQSTFEDNSTPAVLIDRSLPGANLSAVYSDHAAGITAAAEQLIRLGHFHVALINGNPRVRPSRERSAALRKVFKSIPGSDVLVINGSFSERHGYESTIQLFRRSTPVTAVIAGSNQILVGVLRAIRELALTVPEDLSLITCDHSALAELHVPRIDTINRDPSEMGYVAADILRDLINGAPAEQRTLATTYERYASTTTPPRRAT